MSGKKIAVTAYPIGSHVGTIYPSLGACARALDLQQSHISECLAGKRKQHKGYTFQALYYGYYEELKRRQQ